MRILHISIITAVGIGGGIFMILSHANLYPLIDTPTHDYSVFASFDTPGLQNTYKVGQMANFTLVIRGHAMFPCVTPAMKIYNDMTPDKLILDVHSAIMSCPVQTQSQDFQFYFPSKTSSFTTILNKTGNYTLEISYGNETILDSFTVLSLISPNVSTIIIPKGSEEQSSGTNYEPRYLTVVIGVNNTVRWINEADAGNTIVAETYNQPDPLFEKGPYSHGVILPGKSFNFTFTKPGEYQYNTEPHPWLYGWVLVLPQSSENSTQTIVLNNTTIPGPCEMFGIPCPQNADHAFTAQKFGPDVYIEKITINGVDHYAVIHPYRSCAYPPGYSVPCTNPDDITILKLVGVNFTTYP